MGTVLPFKLVDLNSLLVCTVLLHKILNQLNTTDISSRKLPCKWLHFIMNLIFFQLQMWTPYISSNLRNLMGTTFYVIILTKLQVSSFGKLKAPNGSSRLKFLAK